MIFSSCCGNIPVTPSYKGLVANEYRIKENKMTILDTFGNAKQGATTCLRNFMRENPVAFHELTEIYRDRQHRPFGNTEEILTKNSFIERGKDGTIVVYEWLQDIAFQLINGKEVEPLARAAAEALLERLMEENPVASNELIRMCTGPNPLPLFGKTKEVLVAINFVDNYGTVNEWIQTIVFHSIGSSGRHSGSLTVAA